MNNPRVKKRYAKPLIKALCALMILQASISHANPTERIKVGLVLGGGGARGAAHVGVIQKLEELRIPVDCVAGTSMGGLVAGAYSTGMNSKEMREALANADWRDMLIDSPTYDKLSQRNKGISQTFIPATEAGVKDGGLRFPSAVLGGQKIKFFINRMIAADKAPKYIEDQPLQLSLIATDIVTGQRLAYRKGDLATVMRATMSVPGLIAPVKYDGHTLVDGGLVDNVPVREVKEMCQPDVIIAVNVGSPLLKESEIEASPLSVTVQTINLLTEQNVTRSLALLSEKNDIYIQPDLDGITAGDFERNQETVERGYTAAHQMESKLKALSVTPETYTAWLNNNKRPELTSPVVDKIEVVETRDHSTTNMEKQIAQQVGETLDTPKLENDLLYIFGSGHYSNMSYQLLGNKDKTTLRVLPTKKPWGPNFGRAGINFGWGTNETATYNLRLGYQMTQLNKLDGEVLVSGQIGSNNRAGINYYQPIEPRQRAFTELSANFDHQDTALFQNGQAQFEYETNATEINAGMGYNFSHYGIVKAGLLQRWQSANLSIGMSNLLPSKASSDTNGWYVLADFDQMNHLYFPTTGWSARARYFDDGSYSKLSGEAQRAFNFDKFVVTGRVAYVGSVKGQLPLVDAAFLGGPNNLSGLSNRQLIGDNMQYTGLRIERILGKMPLGLRGDLRLGLAAEAGYMGTRYSENQSSGWIKSGGLYLGGETPVGPFFLGVAKASGNKPRVYLFIGTP